MKFEIYTDGGCIKNPGGPGAWAFVVVDRGVTVFESSGYEPVTTNNRMELQAVIEALRWLCENDATATVFSDSDLTVRCGKKQWKRRANVDLWQLFDTLQPQRADLHWVRGHAGNYWNERADEMCTAAIRAGL